MSPNPCIPSNMRQLKTSVRLNEMFFSQVRPVVQLSPTGSLDSFRPWKSTVANKPRASNWLEIQRQTDLLMADVEKCIECNPDHFVSLVGYNDDQVVDCMYLMHTPSRLYGTSCAISTVPLVDPQDLPSDVDDSSS